ncbi:dUTP diphosphatase [Candidatus Woesebacteria bacterium]|nr:dUTP diphosphatase [Candidatus Woesebacteria bacterium]|tara:strand:- start:497 stop:937 length:441 start_codon:yes stop_codon:yes gene_type:complete
MNKEAQPILKFQLSAGVSLPEYANQGDAGFDLRSQERVSLAPGEQHIFKLGLRSEIPPDWAVLLRDRSSLAAKHGLHVHAGVIDSGFRGEWGVVLFNHGKESVTIDEGERIAQGILQPAPQAKIVEVQELSNTERGSGGFGSTGRK